MNRIQVIAKNVIFPSAAPAAAAAAALCDKAVHRASRWELKIAFLRPPYTKNWHFQDPPIQKNTFFPPPHFQME